jgi:hypothetical protein
MVREQALYLAADLPYERAAEVLRRVAGIGLSGRQIQRLVEAESGRIERALGTGHKTAERGLARRFRRAGKSGRTTGADRVARLRRLKTSGLWDAYWSGRVGAADAPDANGDTPPPRRKDAGSR